MRRSELVEEAANSADPARLADLARHRSRELRISCAQNAHLDDQTVDLLSDDPDEVVRMALANVHLAGRPELQRKLAGSPDRGVRQCVAYAFALNDTTSLEYDVQTALAADSDREVRERVASTTCYLDVFEELMVDADPRVRGHCGANPRITESQMARLVGDPRFETRTLAVQGGHRYPTVEQLIALARDRSAEVRWAVIFREGRPLEALEILTEDADDMNRRHAIGAIANRSIDELVTREQIAERLRRSELLKFVEPPTS